MEADHMPKEEIMQRAMDDFMEIQDYMHLAKKRKCCRNICEVKAEVS